MSKYEFYNYRDKLTEGKEMILSHRINCTDNIDISELIDIPIETLSKMYTNSIQKEKEIFETLRNTALIPWQKQAALTADLEKTIQYLKTPSITHTFNKWVENSERGIYEHRNISNMVYTMQYRIYEQTKYDKEKKEEIPISWEIVWNVYVNSANKEKAAVVIAGQQNKKFPSREKADKYIQGRIKAYSHLFIEVSPSIPVSYVENFKVNNMLLPGYTIEKEEKQAAS